MIARLHLFGNVHMSERHVLDLVLPSLWLRWFIVCAISAKVSFWIKALRYQVGGGGLVKIELKIESKTKPKSIEHQIKNEKFINLWYNDDETQNEIKKFGGVAAFNGIFINLNKFH